MILARGATTWSMRERTRAVESMQADESLAQLIDRGLDRAYRLAGLILGNAGEAEEAVGDAIESAFRHARDLRDPAKFEAWFDRILVNRCRDRLRRRTRVRFLPIVGDYVHPVDQFAAVLARDEATAALSVLPPDERAIVVLHFWADLTLEEVARRIGAPVGTVKSRLHRALDRLRAHSIEAGSA